MFLNYHPCQKKLISKKYRERKTAPEGAVSVLLSDLK